MTLTEFYAARLDEDEAAALAWLPFGNPDAATREHIARHDPARVLREVQAGRKILADYEGTRAITGDNDEYVAGLSAALSALASAYSDHPDYDEARREG
jgi:hypothetical protein